MTGPMPARIQRERKPGWRLADATNNPLGAVIVDRTSRYGNPFTVRDCLEYGFAETETEARRHVADRYDEWLDGHGPDTYRLSHRRTYSRQRVLADLAAGALTGRDVACTCPLPAEGQPDHCHGQVLIRRAAPTPPGAAADQPAGGTS